MEHCIEVEASLARSQYTASKCKVWEEKEVDHSVKCNRFWVESRDDSVDAVRAFVSILMPTPRFYFVVVVIGYVASVQHDMASKEMTKRKQKRSRCCAAARWLEES